MKKYQSFTIIFLLSFLLWALHSGNAYAAKRVIIYNGDIHVLDGVSDKVLETIQIKNRVRNVYEIKTFSKANTLFLKGEYQIYAINFDRPELLEDPSIITEWEHVAFLPSSDGNYLYVIWLTQHYIAEMGNGKRAVSRFDHNMKSKVVEGLELNDDISLQDFSQDGKKLYIVRGYKPSRIQVINFTSKKIIKDISFDEIGRKNVFSKVAHDMINNKILISETIKDSDYYRSVYYVYDIENDDISINIEKKSLYDCRLMTSGHKIVCDEENRIKDSIFKLGKLHFFDVQSGREIGYIDVSSRVREDSKNASSYNQIAGITPDGGKVYYRTWSGTIVIDAERYKIIRTLDHLGGLMSFFEH